MKFGEEFKGIRKSDGHSTLFKVGLCKECNKLFISEKNKGRFFCSKSCSAKSNARGKFGDKNSRWKGGIIEDGNGYILEYIPSTKKHRRQHLKVWEEISGEKLKKGEIIHHIDFDRKNNDISNLMKFKSNRDHMLFHHKLNLKMIEILNGLNYNLAEETLLGLNFKHNGKLVNPELIQIEKGKIHKNGKVYHS